MRTSGMMRALAVSWRRGTTPAEIMCSTSVRDKLTGARDEGIQVQRGFLGLVAVGDERGQQLDQAVERTALARVFDLADVLELIDKRLDNRALAQQQRIRDRQQPGAHILAQFG